MVAPSDAGRPPARASLSVVCMTAGPGPRVAAILELLRPLAAEIIVAVDDRADEAVADDVATVADRVISYPFAQPVDRPLPWLFTECRGDWMLTLDDDEVPSVALIDALGDLVADDRVVLYSLARKWVFPDRRSFLADTPWHPDYQLRLVRTDPRLIRFSDDLHRPIVPLGPARFVRESLLHLDPILRTQAERLRKAHRYEEMRAGMRTAGRALNYAFYVPETIADARLERLDDADRTLVEAILGAGRPTGAPRALRETVSREEIDRHWPSHRSEKRGVLHVVETLQPFRTREERALDVAVRNTGSETWQWGGAGLATIRCAARWDDDERAAAVWTPLPGPVAPEETIVVPVHVVAPEKPGRHTLLLDLVHQDVRWFGLDVACEVDVVAPRRVACLGVGAETIRAILARDPELEPLVLAASPRASAHDGYREAPSAWPYLTADAPAARGRLVVLMLLRAAWLLLSARSGDGPPGARPFVTALAGCELLVVGDAPTTAPRRERFAHSVAIATARVLGIPVIRAQ